MSALIQRNLMIYFKNRSGVIFSILGALISFVLYIVFLRESMMGNWQQLNEGVQLLDLWLIGGTLTVTAITSTLAGLAQMVEDRERNVLNDITLGGLKEITKNLSYVISGSMIGVVMQMILLILMLLYFTVADRIEIPFSQMPVVFLIMLLSSLCFSLFFFALVSLIKTKNTLSKIETIFGTASGFLACVYVPVGMLPDFGQTVIKSTPAIYLAALYREVLLSPTLTKIAQVVPEKELLAAKNQLGIEIKWGDISASGYEIVILLGIGCLGLLMVYLTAQRKKNSLA